jgi:hypothetical protein
MITPTAIMIFSLRLRRLLLRELATTNLHENRLASE